MLTFSRKHSFCYVLVTFPIVAAKWHTGRGVVGVGWLEGPLELKEWDPFCLLAWIGRRGAIVWNGTVKAETAAWAVEQKNVTWTVEKKIDVGSLEEKARPRTENKQRNRKSWIEYNLLSCLFRILWLNIVSLISLIHVSNELYYVSSACCLYLFLLLALPVKYPNEPTRKIGRIIEF